MGVNSRGQFNGYYQKRKWFTPGLAIELLPLLESELLKQRIPPKKVLFYCSVFKDRYVSGVTVVGISLSSPVEKVRIREIIKDCDDLALGILRDRHKAGTGGHDV